MRKLVDAFTFSNLKRTIAICLTSCMTLESVQAVPLAPAAGQTNFSIALPSTLGYVTDSYAAGRPAATHPDVILIQNLHVNRSVQFAISGILKHLQEQNLLPQRIAVEGATGTMDIASMQAYPDAKVRKAAADYLVEQGEMPGAMHFAVTEGDEGRKEGRTELYGVETPELYQANLELYQRSYEQRRRLSEELNKYKAAIPQLERDTALHEKAILLNSDIDAALNLLNNRATPDELTSALHKMLGSIDRLKAILPSELSADLIETLSSGAHFYSFALMRNDDLFNNTVALRNQDQQQTTVLITGGFHTPGLAERCKAKGLSYIVITPTVRRHDKIDETLYVNRLLGRHLTPEQVAQGLDWAAQEQLEVLYQAGSLFASAITAVTLPPRRKIATAFIAALVPFSFMAPGQVRQSQTEVVLQVPAPSPSNWQHPVIQQSVRFLLETLRLPGSALVRSFNVPIERDAKLAAVDPNSQSFVARGFANTYDQALAAEVAIHSGNKARALEIIQEFAERGIPPGRSNVEPVVITGEVVWMGIAAADYARAFGTNSVTTAMMKIVDDYLKQMRQSDGRIKGGPGQDWTSTEHNISTLMYLSKHYALTKNPGIQNLRLDIARWLVSHAYIPSQKRFRRGQNDDVFATDVQTWGALAMITLKNEDPAFYKESGLAAIDINGLLQSVEQHAHVTQHFESDGSDGVVRSGDVSGARYGDSGPVSVEWTYELATAYYFNGDTQRAADLGRIANITRSPATGGLPSAVAPGRTFSDGWTVNRFLSDAGTAMFILFETRVNYFSLSVAPANPPVPLRGATQVPAAVPQVIAQTPRQTVPAAAPQAAQAGWRTIANGPTGQPWTDGRAYSVFADGRFNLTGVKTIRLTFSPSQAGTKFRLRLVPEGADFNIETGVRQELITIPANGIIELPFSPAEFGLDETQTGELVQIAVLSGDNSWNRPMGQAATKHAVFSRVEVANVAASHLQQVPAAAPVQAQPRAPAPKANAAQAGNWRTMANRPTGQPWTDGRAYSVYADGHFNFTGAKSIRITFSPSQAGTKFRLRLIPENTDFNQPIGVRQEVITIPSNGIVEMPLNPGEFGLDASQLRNIIQIAVLSGDNSWNRPMGQAATKHAVFSKVEALFPGRAAGRFLPVILAKGTSLVSGAAKVAMSVALVIVGVSMATSLVVKSGYAETINSQTVQTLASNVSTVAHPTWFVSPTFALALLVTAALGIAMAVYSRGQIRSSLRGQRGSAKTWFLIGVGVVAGLIVANLGNLKTIFHSKSIVEVGPITLGPPSGPWVMVVNGPTGQPWTDGRAYSVYADGHFDFSKTYWVAIRFPESEAGTKFRLRLVPEGADPNQEIGVRYESLTIPANGIVTLRLIPSEFGFDPSGMSNIIQVAILSGDNSFNRPLGQSADKHAHFLSVSIPKPLTGGVIEPVENPQAQPQEPAQAVPQATVPQQAAWKPIAGGPTGQPWTDGRAYSVFADGHFDLSAIKTLKITFSPSQAGTKFRLRLVPEGADFNQEVGVRQESITIPANGIVVLPLNAAEFGLDDSQLKNTVQIAVLSGDNSWNRPLGQPATKHAVFSQIEGSESPMMGGLLIRSQKGWLLVMSRAGYVIATMIVSIGIFIGQLGTSKAQTLPSSQLQTSFQVANAVESGWKTVTNGPTGQPWTDGRAYSVFADGNYDFSQAKAIRMTFSSSQAGTKFRLRLVPEGTDFNQPTGVRQDLITIPANGIVELPFDPAEFGLDTSDTKHLVQIAVLSGDNSWNQPMNQAASKHAVFSKIEISNATAAATPQAAAQEPTPTPAKAQAAAPQRPVLANRVVIPFDPAASERSDTIAGAWFDRRNEDLSGYQVQVALTGPVETKVQFSFTPVSGDLIGMTNPVTLTGEPQILSVDLDTLGVNLKNGGRFEVNYGATVNGQPLNNAMPAEGTVQIKEFVLIRTGKVSPAVPAPAPQASTPRAASTSEASPAQSPSSSQAGAWRTLVDGPTGQPWTDGRAYSAYADGQFNLSGAKSIRLTFSPSEAGTKFRLRLVPEGADFNQPTGVRQAVITIPASGIVELPLNPREFGLRASDLRHIAQIAVLSGDNSWNRPIGQAADKHAVFLKIEILSPGVALIERGWATILKSAAALIIGLGLFFGQSAAKAQTPPVNQPNLSAQAQQSETLQAQVQTRQGPTAVLEAHFEESAGADQAGVYDQGVDHSIYWDFPTLRQKNRFTYADVTLSGPKGTKVLFQFLPDIARAGQPVGLIRTPITLSQEGENTFRIPMALVGTAQFAQVTAHSGQRPFGISLNSDKVAITPVRMRLVELTPTEARSFTQNSIQPVVSASASAGAAAAQNTSASSSSDYQTLGIRQATDRPDYDDGMAHAVAFQGRWDLSNAKKIRLTFPKEQAGVKFRLRILPHDETPNDPNGLRHEPFVIPENGIVEITIDPKEYGLTPEQLKDVDQVSIHSGDNSWNEELGQTPDRHADPIKLEISGAKKISGQLQMSPTLIALNGKAIATAVSTALAAALGLSYMMQHAATQVGTMAPQFPSSQILTSGIQVHSPHEAILLLAFLAGVVLINRLITSRRNKATTDALRAALPKMPISDAVADYVRPVLDYAPLWLRDFLLKNPALAARYGAQINQMGILAIVRAA